MKTHRAAAAAAALLFTASIFSPPVRAQDSEPPPKRIHAIIALCDNDFQGIVKVGAKIGNGDDPAGNLYWGCSDGLWRYFSNDSGWTLIESKKAEPDPRKEDPLKGLTILETLTFKHNSTGAILTAEAWRGREIKAATAKFFSLLESNARDSPDLVAFIGHNGLMDFRLPEEAGSATSKSEKSKDAVVLCCLSRSYFDAKLTARGARPILMTEQLMYPGSFLLKTALDGWLLGESRQQMRERAARAYAKNQKISIGAARGVFSDLEKE